MQYITTDVNVETNLALTHATKKSTNRKILEEYSSLKISAKDAMSLLNLQCLEELFKLTSTNGFPLPHLDRKTATSMANEFLKAVQ